MASMLTSVDVNSIRYPNLTCLRRMPCYTQRYMNALSYAVLHMCSKAS